MAVFALLYGIVAYIPNSLNAVLDPIPHGPVCDSCGGANISGDPLVTALTDPTGKFVLKNVPAGSNIPLVIQAGKWRRKLLVPTVTACADNQIPDTMNPDTRRLLRVGLGDLPAERTASTLTMLMGRAESQARRAWLEEHGNEAEADV